MVELQTVTKEEVEASLLQKQQEIESANNGSGAGGEGGGAGNENGAGTENANTGKENEAAEVETVLEPNAAFSFLTTPPGDKPGTQVEIPAEFKSQLEQLTKVKTDYETRFKKEAEDPFLKTYRLADEAGMTPEQTKEAILKVAAELVGKDDSNRNFDDLLRMETERMTGLKGEELDQAVKEEKESYLSQTPLQKARYEQELRAKFKQAGGESPTLKALEQSLQTHKQTAEQIAKENLALAIQDKQDLTTVANMFKGQTILGLEVSEEMAKEIIDSYDNPPFNYTDERGAFNSQRYAIDVFKVKYFDKLISAAFDQGKKAAIKKQINPDGTGTVASTAPAAGKTDPNEAYKKSLDNDTLKSVEFNDLPPNVQAVIKSNFKQTS